MALILKANCEEDSVLGGAFLSLLKFSHVCLLARWMWVINKYSFREAQIVYHVLIKYIVRLILIDYDSEPLTYRRHLPCSKRFLHECKIIDCKNLCRFSEVPRLDFDRLSLTAKAPFLKRAIMLLTWVYKVLKRSQMAYKKLSICSNSKFLRSLNSARLYPHHSWNSAEMWIAIMWLLIIKNRRSKDAEQF